jgi:hypothetical protein
MNLSPQPNQDATLKDQFSEDYIVARMFCIHCFNTSHLVTVDNKLSNLFPRRKTEKEEHLQSATALNSV